MSVSVYEQQTSHYASVRARLMNPPPRVVPAPVVLPQKEVQRAIDPVPAPTVEVEAHFAWQGGPVVSMPKKAAWKTILREVAEKHGVHPNDIRSNRRDKAIIYARHELFYRMREETSLSYPEIGQRLGGKDHTTVLHGCRMHKLRMEAEGVFPITNKQDVGTSNSSTKNLNPAQSKGFVTVSQF